MEESDKSSHSYTCERGLQLFKFLSCELIFSKVWEPTKMRTNWDTWLDPLACAASHHGNHDDQVEAPTCSKPLEIMRHAFTLHGLLT
jgi:hypothetical protein